MDVATNLDANSSIQKLIENLGNPNVAAMTDSQIADLLKKLGASTNLASLLKNKQTSFA